MSRGGKATGKYQLYLNTRNLENETTQCIDWSRIEKWRPINTMKHVSISESSIPNDDIYCAKIDELKKWKDNDNVYELVQFIGQNTNSTRWVVTEKHLNGEKRTKARLAASGFEEENSEILKDSPICTKERF